MKVINPNHQSDVGQFVSANKAAISDYLSNNADKPAVTFDQIRADFPGLSDPVTGAPPMSDGTITEIFKALGYEVTE